MYILCAYYGTVEEEAEEEEEEEGSGAAGNYRRNECAEAGAAKAEDCNL